VLDGDDDDVAEPSVTLAGAAEHLDDARDARARIVRDRDDATWLNHGVAVLPLALDALDEVEKPPAFVLAQRSRLHESDDVPHLGLVLLVVNLELVPAADVLAVGLVLDQTLDRKHDRLVHPVPPDPRRHRLSV